MTDIPEGLVEAVARAIADEHGCDFGWCDAAPKAARAAILAHNAWLTANDARIQAFVAFQGPNPRD